MNPKVFHKTTKAGLLAGALIGLTACCSVNSETTQEAAMNPEAVPATSNEAVVATAEQVQVIQAIPRAVRVGHPFSYTMTVKNTGNTDVAEVVVTQLSAENFNLQSSVPAASTNTANGKSIWNVGDLKAAETKEITLTGIAPVDGKVMNCVKVDYIHKQCAATMAVEPKLEVIKTSTEANVICDPICIKVKVSNPGTGDLTDVVITDNLPEGLTAPDGGKVVSVVVGELPAGSEKEVDYQVMAAKTGTYNHTVTVTACDGMTAQAASVTTIVTQPVLEVTQTATPQQYAGRDIMVNNTVTNTGDGIAENVILTQVLPAGVQILEASQDYTLGTDNTISWTIPFVKPGMKETRNVKYTTCDIGVTLDTSVSANAKCVTDAAAKASTKVIGAPGLNVQVRDLCDPVQVGDEVTYQITVENQGTIPVTNVKLMCEMEDQEDYISSTGATTVATAGAKVVEFGAVGTMAPKTQHVWTVVVKAKDAGDVRFKVNVHYDQSKRPITAEEPTTIY